jgi:hypothetical protein
MRTGLSRSGCSADSSFAFNPTMLLGSLFELCQILRIRSGTSRRKLRPRKKAKQRLNRIRRKLKVCALVADHKQARDMPACVFLQLISSLYAPTLSSAMHVAARLHKKCPKKKRQGKTPCRWKRFRNITECAPNAGLHPMDIYSALFRLYGSPRLKVPRNIVRSEAL